MMSSKSKSKSPNPSNISSTRLTVKTPLKIQIQERNEEEVSYAWKICQLFSYAIVIVSGIASSLAIGTIQKIFDYNCIMYANLTVVGFEDQIITIRQNITNWGSRGLCEFCIYSPVSSVIFGGILGTFFIMCGRGGSGSNLGLIKPWRIVPPAIIFNLIFSILAIITISLTFNGFSKFCSNISPSLNITYCAQLLDVSFEQFPGSGKFYAEVIAAEIAQSFCLVGWILSFLILLVRCFTHADFVIMVPSSVNTTTTNNESSVEGQYYSNMSSKGPSGCPSPNGESQNTTFTQLHSNESSQLTTPEKHRNIVNVDVEPLIKD